MVKQISTIRLAISCFDKMWHCSSWKDLYRSLKVIGSHMIQ